MGVKKIVDVGVSMSLGMAVVVYVTEGIGVDEGASVATETVGESDPIRSQPVTVAIHMSKGRIIDEQLVNPARL